MSRQAGAQAEERAAFFLKGQGYRILERNLRAGGGEIDIVARDGDTLVFVEVRLRRSASFGSPAETVGPAKRRRLVRAALAYAQALDLDCPMRFDVVALEGGGLEHIPGAFGAD